MYGLRLYGLTGGIGSGKSTVARLVRAKGVPVIDADALAREVVEPGQPAHAAIAALWPEALAADGRIDRQRLGAIVFANAEARARLEAITHPRIRERVRQVAQSFEDEGHPLAFLEAALLVETGFHRDLDGLVLVVAGEAQRIARVGARDGVAPEQVLARLRAQTTDDDRRRVATHVIDNSGDEAATGAQVDELLAKI